ncbi:hypothetical protein CSC70_13195 [Pseudoxanthomonas kalamensis DSM 18571]|nr:hypothetical protein [Pseudoxanthomonas kalamensis]KAF1708322.1 hypothetical protein CSC70_13195 [Pseudoxanthomonas kalamensis DSM 18571]
MDDAARQTGEPAPELPRSLVWLNASPGSLHELRGCAVALAFVNPGSIWCAQRLHELVQLQSRYPGRLQVLAVLVPRFDCERDGDLAMKQLRRRGLTLPMLLDADWHAWQRFGIASWPTVVLIDAEGCERARIEGVASANRLEPAVASICERLPSPLDEDTRLPPETHPEPRLPLRFPTAVVATAERLYIADSGHHRVLECNHAGRVLRQFGMGTADFADGEGELAAFRRPQALALGRETLYVADTGNHALRRISLGSGQVDTLCGSGKPGATTEGRIDNPRAVALDHPTGLVATNSELYLVQSGANSIWRYDLGTHVIDRLAGSGQLGMRDGLGGMASFAQPAGLALVQQALYVSDALGSAIRSLQLRNQTVQTLVGRGIWEFGQQDGSREQALMQYPQGIALNPGAPQLWIVDAGNGSLRSLRLGGGVVSTVDLPRPLRGACGLSVAAGKLWIAETDAHAILCFDPASGELQQIPVGE